MQSRWGFQGKKQAAVQTGGSLALLGRQLACALSAGGV